MKISEAITYPKVKELSDSQIREQVGECLVKLAFDLGHKVDDNEAFLLLVSEFCKEVKETFSYLSIQEIQLAFGKGARKEYPDLMVFLAPAPLSNVLMAYVTSAERKASINDLNTKRLPSPTLSVELQEKSLYDGLKKYIQENNKLPLIWGWVGVYNHCVRIGEINLTKDEKQMFAELVKAELNEKAAKEHIKMNREGYKEIEDLICDKLSFANECKKEMVKKRFEV